MEDWAEIRRLHRAERLPIKAIARVTGVSRNTVRRALAAEGPPRYHVEQATQPRPGQGRRVDAQSGEGCERAGAGEVENPDARDERHRVAGEPGQ